MDKAQIQKMIDDTIARTLMSNTNEIVPRHMHNGADSPRIPFSNISPFAPLNANNIGTSLGATQAGSNTLFDFSDNLINPTLSNWSWGPMWYLNNQWNSLDIADFYVDVYQLASNQTIANGDIDIILFDTIGSQYPGEYDVATGKFEPILNNAGDKFIYPGYYLVTASIGITPTNALGFIDIVVEVDGDTKADKVVANPGIDFSVDISVLLKDDITDYIAIRIGNGTGASIHTVNSQPVTYLKVKKIPGIY